jgi:hypothetical protein
VTIHHCKSGAAGVLIDRGTGRRIPFAVWFDPETGDYEHFQPAANGVDMACDEDWNPIRVRGRAKGKLELVPLGEAAKVGWKEPAKVRETIKLTNEDREAGLEQYKKVYVHVWQDRGEARRIVDDRWEEYLRKSSFFDDLILKRLKRKPVRIHTG